MRCHPRGVMDHGVHGVAHIDDPAEPAETKHDKRKSSCEDHWLMPRQRADPAKQAPAAAAAPRYFKACAD